MHKWLDLSGYFCVRLAHVYALARGERTRRIRAGEEARVHTGAGREDDYGKDRRRSGAFAVHTTVYHGSNCMSMIMCWLFENVPSVSGFPVSNPIPPTPRKPRGTGRPRIQSRRRHGRPPGSDYSLPTSCCGYALRLSPGTLQPYSWRNN